MLHSLSVKNFAIIENIEIEFNNDMTALTGETGAGKSLLIDAIGLLLGDRASSEVVREGYDKAIIEGLFYFNSSNIADLLNEYGIEYEDDLLIIKREITLSNKNIIRVNNNNVTLLQLKNITRYLADIHTQLDTQRLINPSTYLDLIDGFEKMEIEILLDEYTLNLKKYKDAIKDYNKMKNNHDLLNEKLDLYKFQLSELEKANLNMDEEEHLLEESKKLANFDKIYNSLQQSYTNLVLSESIDNIYTTINHLEKISEYSDKYENFSKKIKEAYYELEDISSSIKSEIDLLDFNPEILNSVETRLGEIDNLKRKYRKDLKDLIAYKNKIEEEIKNVENYDEVLNELLENVKINFENLKESANTITIKRKGISQKLKRELKEILNDLSLPNTNFEIKFLNEEIIDYFDQSKFYQNGVDEVDFLISTNVGESLKPLSKTASGGEMSRIMLGFKTLLVKSQKLSTIIFDEIDTGVSGFVANKVAKKMKEISKYSQVICITHIPQVAAITNHHLFVSKHEINGRTNVKIIFLDKKQKIKEIASMISGDLVTETSLNTAKELILNSN